MIIGRPQIRVVQQQSEEISSDRELSDEETKSFLYKNYPDLYKQMYPGKVIDNETGTEYRDPSRGQQVPVPLEKRTGNEDIQKSNKTYTHDKYGSEQIDGSNGFSYKIEIKTDMNIRRD